METRNLLFSQAASTTLFKKPQIWDIFGALYGFYSAELMKYCI